MIRPRFKKKDVSDYLKGKVEELEKKVVAQLRVVGEMAVNMAREKGNNNPAGFPVNYTNFPHPRPLKQRIIRQQDIDKNPHVKQPAFGDYLELSGNLTSSIGFFICKNGKVIDQEPGKVGAAKSRSLAREMAKGRKGFVLVITAGMEYAARVEAYGYDVLTTSELWAEKTAAKLLKQLLTQPKRR